MLTTALPTKHTQINTAHSTLAASSLSPIPAGQPFTGPMRERKSTGTTTGSHASAAVQPHGCSSAGV